VNAKSIMGVMLLAAVPAMVRARIEGETRPMPWRDRPVRIRLLIWQEGLQPDNATRQLP
jgi:hypothetical protein